MSNTTEGENEWHRRFDGLMGKDSGLSAEETRSLVLYKEDLAKLEMTMATLKYSDYHEEQPRVLHL